MTSRSLSSSHTARRFAALSATGLRHNWLGNISVLLAFPSNGFTVRRRRQAVKPMATHGRGKNQNSASQFEDGAHAETGGRKTCEGRASVAHAIYLNTV